MHCGLGRRGATWTIGASLALWLAEALLSGCGGKQPAEGGGATSAALLFVVPVDGATVAARDDVDPAAPGLQINVLLQVSPASANRGELTLTVADTAPGSTLGSPAVKAQVVRGRAVFPGITLPVGTTVVLRAQWSQAPADASCAGGDQCAEVRVVAAAQPVCAFFAPRDGAVLIQDGYTTASDAPDPADPFETDVAVDCLALAQGAYVALSANGAAPAVLRTGGAQVAQRLLFPRVALQEGANRLTFFPNTDATGTLTPAGSVAVDLTVGSGRCRVQLLPADRSLFLNNADQVPLSDGLQTTLELVSDCVAASSVQLFIKAPGATRYITLYAGVPAPAPVLEADGAHWRLSGLSLPESVTAYDVALVGRVDAADGRFGTTLPQFYWVDSVVPTVSRVEPADNFCFNGRDDAAPQLAGVQRDVSGAAQGTQQGGAAWLRVYPDTQAEAATQRLCVTNEECAPPTQCMRGYCRHVAAVTDGAFMLDDLTFPEGAAILEVVAVDAAGNVSPALYHAGTVYPAQPRLTILAPPDSAKLGVADDADLVAEGLQYNAQFALTDIPENATLILSLSGQEVARLTPPTGTTALFMVPLVVAADGSYTLSATLQHPCGDSFAADSTAAFAVRLHPAPLLVRAVERNDTGFDWPLNDGAVVRAAAIDLQATVGTSTEARELTVENAPAVEVGVDGASVCRGTAALLAQLPVDPSQTDVLLTALPINPGINCLSVTVSDGFNRVSQVFVLEGRPLPTPHLEAWMPEPPWRVAEDDSDANPGNGFNFSIAAALAAAAPYDVNLTVQLWLSGLSAAPSLLLGAATLPAGATQVAFTDLGLPVGSYSIVPRVLDAAEHGVSGTAKSVSFVASSVTAPQVLITAPSANATLNNAAFAVTVQDLGGAVPVACRLYYNGVLAALVDDTAGPAWGLFPQAPLVLDAAVEMDPDGPGGAGAAPQSIQVQVACEGSDGAVGFSQEVPVVVDDLAPSAPTFVDEALGVPGRLVYAPPGYVNSLVSDASESLGLQHTVVVAFDAGAEDPLGWTIRLTATPPQAAPTLYEYVVRDGDNVGAIAFADVDFGSTDGALSLTAQVLDRAGNASAATTVVVTVDRTGPQLTQIVPVATTKVLSRVDDVNIDAANIDIVFSYNVAGAATGSFITQSINPVPVGGAGLVWPRQILVGSGTRSFPVLAFADGAYTATTRVVDIAGNETVVVHAFQVQKDAAGITFALPRTPGVLSLAQDTHPEIAGFDGNFSFNAVGLASGTPVRLCSTAGPSPAAACRWGVDAAGAAFLGGEARGVVVATGLLSGTTALTTVFLADVPLPDGTQILHAEAVEADLSPDVSTPFLTFTVDSVRPNVTSFVLVQNSTDNDAPGLLRLGAAEGTVDGALLRTQVSISATGVEENRPLAVYSDYPAPRTLVASGTLAAGGASLSLALQAAAQQLSVEVTDAAGNVSDPSLDAAAVQDILVDLQGGIAAVQSAALPLYTAVHGTVDTGATPERDDDTLVLGTAVTVTVSDNNSLAGAGVTLVNTTTGWSAQKALTVGSNCTPAPCQRVSFEGVPLAMGRNSLQATLIDATGNSTISAVQDYLADFYGPLLFLDMADGATPPQILACGSDEASACSTDVDEPDAITYRAALDATAGVDYCPLLADPCNEAGSNLLFRVVGCANSDSSVEDCATTAIQVWLESRIAGSEAEWTEVFGSQFALGADVGLMSDAATAQSYRSRAPGFAFAAGVTREVQLVAVDKNGNISRSAPLFLQNNISGVLVEAYRLNADGVKVERLGAQDNYFGKAENLSADPALFSMPLQIETTSITSEVAGSYQLYVNGSMAAADPLYPALFPGVVLQTSSAGNQPIGNTLHILVECDGHLCGGRDYEFLVADVDPPTFQFNRCSLCAVKVPLTDASFCSTATSCLPAQTDGQTGANIAAAGAALWNIAQDGDANPSNGFSPPPSQPLVVELKGVEQGLTVRLASTAGALVGAQASAVGCAPGAANCVASATFAGLQVPTLAAPGPYQHVISVVATDRAGNLAVPMSGRDPEVITATTDLVVPGGVRPIVCTGDTTSDDASCASVCAAAGNECSRRYGRVTLSWTAPGEDGSSGGTVTAYKIAVAARGVRYGSTTYTACSQLTAAGPFERETLVTPAGGIAYGGAVSTSLAALYPHRSYCFVVTAIDDVGNAAGFNSCCVGVDCAAGTACAVERSLPLLNFPTPVSFDPVSSGDDAVAAAAYSVAAGTDFGAPVLNVGDMDADGRDDFAVSNINWGDSGPPCTVLLFLSARDLSDPISIASPTADNGFFGWNLGAGDFDGDGLPDLAICEPGKSVTGRLFGGALFLYYGTAGTGISLTANGGSDADLPSWLPDVALFGTEGAVFCNEVIFADVDGTAGAEMIVSTDPGSLTPRVYGFSVSGFPDHTFLAATRFPATPPSGLPPVKINLDLDTLTPAQADRPNFAFKRKNDNYFFFPTRLAAADLNGDGKQEVIISDNGAAHAAGVCSGCGEVYVYAGGPLLTGLIDAPDASPAPAALSYIVRGPLNTGLFGQYVYRVVAPRAPTDLADWLLINVANEEVFVFKATSVGTTPGLVPASYPVGGRPAREYIGLDRTDWGGTTRIPFGNNFAFLGDFDGHAGVDILLGPGNVGNGAYVFIYSYNSATEVFDKRVVLRGTAEFGFGAASAGLFADVGSTAGQIVVSRKGGAGSYLFIYY